MGPQVPRNSASKLAAMTEHDLRNGEERSIVVSFYAVRPLPLQQSLLCEIMTAHEIS